MSQPEVSAIIPTYNRREWVQLAIDSVLAQRGVAVECIVVDDGSSDGTGDALRARYGDRIRYIYQENQGESAARNRGAAEARGEFLAFLDSDDLWLPGKLARQVDFLRRDPDCGAVYCQAYAIDERGREILRLPYGTHVRGSRISLHQILTSGLPLSGSTPMIRATAFQHIGGYDVHIRHGEDVDIAARLLLDDYAVGMIPRQLAKIRSHRGSQSLALQEDKFLASHRDHNRMYDSIEKRASTPALSGARQKEDMRLLVYAIQAGNLALAGQYLRLPHLPQPIPASLYDAQIEYFTPLLYRETPDPRRIVESIRAVFAFRDAHAPGSRSSRQDALVILRAAEWCARQSAAHAGFAWRQVLAELRRQPGLLFAPAFWKLIARLVFGRLYTRLYLFKSHLSDD